MNMTSQNSVAIVGLGYVGLPLAVLAQEKTWKVTGIDIDKNKVDTINRKLTPFKDEELQRQLNKHPIEATTDIAAVKGKDIVIVAVPTPVNENHQPDLTPLTSALESMRKYLRPGQVLIIESTINPGVMEEIVVPLLQEEPDLITDFKNNDKEAIYLVHCPERINPGDPKWTVRNIPRVLGGFSDVVGHIS